MMTNKTEDNTGQELVASSNSSLQTTESLPVLAAFSDFIKTEQRRSRNRMIIMGFLFTLVIIVIIGAGVFIGTAFYNQVHTDLRQTKNDLSSYHIKNEREQQINEKKLSRIQAIASNIAHNIYQQKQALQATQKSIASSKNNYQQELIDMKQVIDSLSLENKELKENSEQTNIKLPEITAQLNDLIKIITTSVKPPVEETIDNKVPIPVASQPPETIEVTETIKVPYMPEHQEITEPTETIENKSNLKINTEDQTDNIDLMMLLPTLE